MSSHAIPKLGPPGIHTVVIARGAAQKIKELSTSHFADRQKRLDQGGFAITFIDDPAASPLENSLQSRLGGRDRRRRSNTTTTMSSEHELHPAQLEMQNANRSDPGGSQRGRRSTTTASSAFGDNISDSELENASPRRRRLTTATKPSKTISSGVQRLFIEPETYNTYHMEPQKKFEHWKVTEIIKKAFEERLIASSYDREFCQYMSKMIADSIKEQVKSLQFSRYKIISVVSIGQKTGQSVRMASTFAWDSRFDCYAQYVFERADIYAFGVVYGIYCE